MIRSPRMRAVAETLACLVTLAAVTTIVALADPGTLFALCTIGSICYLVYEVTR